MRNVIREIVVIAVLIAATLAVYWPVRHHDFIEFDDPFYIGWNQQVEKGLSWEGVKYAFTTRDVSNWHPLTWLSHMLDSQLFGVSKNSQTGTGPGGHHLVSVGFHIANVVFLFLLLRSMTGQIWLSAFVAGAFALHPLRIESVAWASERKDVLSAFFGILAIWAYVGYVRRGSGWRYALVMLLFACSLMSKPMFVTLPFLLLVLDYWPLKRIGVFSRPADGLGGVREPLIDGPGWSWRIARPLIIDKLPLVAMSIASSVVTIMVQHFGGSIETAQALPFQHRVGNALVSYARYLGKTFWPSDLSIMYPHPGAWPLGTVAASLLMLIAVTIAALAIAKRHPYVIVGWVWFVGMLVPVIGLIQVGTQAMADRYTYVPQIGLFIAAGWLAFALLGKSRAALTGAYGVMILVLLWFATSLNVPLWANTEGLYRHALKVTDGNWLIESNLAAVLKKDGRLSEATDHLSKAIAIREKFSDAHFMMADIAYQQGRYADSIAAFHRAIEIEPDWKEAMNSLAWELATVPDANLRNGPEALRLAERSCELNQYNDPNAIDTLAVALASVGRFDDAVTMAQKAHDRALKIGDESSAKDFAKRAEFFATRRPLIVDPTGGRGPQR